MQRDAPLVGRDRLVVRLQPVVGIGEVVPEYRLRPHRQRREAFRQRQGSFVDGECLGVGVQLGEKTTEVDQDIEARPGRLRRGDRREDLERRFVALPCAVVITLFPAHGPET